jgi:CO/xanthine dehydrogenase FAD-binding subunit
VAVAFAPHERSWRVAVGGVAPRPALLVDAASALGSGRPSADAIHRAAESTSASAAFVTDRRASEEFRRRLVGTLVERAVSTVLTQKEFPA